MRILHLTNWYPNNTNPYEALWIQKHVEALDANVIYSSVIHLNVENSNRIKWENYKSKRDVRHFLLKIPFHIWRINEWVTFILLWYVLLFKVQLSRYDLINIHIAYPLCVYLGWIKRFTKLPIVITEHWSAYHFGFHISNLKKKKRIQQIFHHETPVITVSEALKNDIKKFANTNNFPSYVIPNIVDTRIFYFKNIPISSNPTFFMVSQWKAPKQPILVLEAFQEIIQFYPHAKLRIGGYGPQEKQIRDFILNNQLQNHVRYLGKLSPMSIADEMNAAWGFIHPSDYETFSVVCAEAVCCGTPVIASNVGGIPEFVVNNNNGILVENSPEKFLAAIKEVIQLQNKFDRKKISESTRAIFSKEAVGKNYFEVLQKIHSASI